MNKKIVMTIVILSSSLICNAQNSFYSTNNFVSWTVVKADVNDKYVVVIPATKEITPEKMNPICVLNDKMIFRYEMIGMDDSFYDKSEQATDLNLLNNFTNVNKNYLLKIDTEEDNSNNGNLADLYAKICKANKADIYLNNSSVNYHGIVKYIGDINIKPPF